MDKLYLQKLAKQIKKLRKEKGLTQDDIASDEVSRSMISLLETARTDVTVSKLKKIANNLEVTMRKIFEFD